MRIETILGAERGAVKEKQSTNRLFGLLILLILLPCFVGCTAQSPAPQTAHYKDAKTGREAYAVPRHAAPLFDPHLASQLLDDPKRDAWQKPRQIVNALNLKAGDSVADIGTGSGYLLPYLSRAVGPHGLVFAEEIQSAFLPALKRNARAFKNVRVVQGTMDNPKLPQKVDYFVLLTTYHEVENPIAFLKTLKRYAKPGARLAIIDFDAARRGNPSAPSGHEIADVVVIAEAKAAGWELEKQHEFLSSQFFLMFNRVKMTNP